MSSCSVKHCKNYSGKKSSQPAISYFGFPKSPALKRKWVEAIGRNEDWLPTKYSRVCSVHFEESSYDISETGIKRLHKDAVPTKYLIIPVYTNINPPTLGHEGHPHDPPLTHLQHHGPARGRQMTVSIKRLRHKVQLQSKTISRLRNALGRCKLGDPRRRNVELEKQTPRNVTKPQGNDSNNNGICRICLVTNTKLYRMQDHTLQTLYEQLTGLRVFTTDLLPEHLCWECAHRLVSCHRLRSRALRSHELMVDLLNTDGCLTTKSIKLIDRKLNNLSSRLVQTSDNVNHELQLYDESNMKLNDIDVCKKEQDTIQKVHEDFQEINFQGVNVNLQDVDEDFHKDQHGIDIITKTDNEFEIKKEESDSTNDVDIDFLWEGDSSSSDYVVLVKEQEDIKENKVRRKRTANEGAVTPKVDKRFKPVNQAINTKLFTVTTLTFDEQISAFKKRQDRVCYKNSQYKCTDCYRGFLSEESYKTHMIRHTNRIGTYVCKICKIHWKSSHNLRDHSVGHKQRISCNLCPYATSARHAANIHEKYHNGTKYQCPHCEHNFTKLTTYMNHVRNKHPSGFLCGLCGRSYVGERGLRMHMKKRHRFDDETIPEDGPYCQPCEVRFASQGAFDTHLKSTARHNYTREYVPRTRSNITKKMGNEELKGKSAGTGIVLKWRKPLGLMKMRKADGPPVPCELCDTQLPDPKAYHHHFKREHPDKNRTSYPSMKTPCMCEVCGKLFSNMAFLHDHSTTHSESVQFKCDQCGKIFQSKYRLVFHTRTHEMKRPTHPCGECGKHFSTLGNMNKHRLIHTGLKPYKCEMCGKCFKSPSEKRAHITYVHLKKPWPKRNRDRRNGERQNRQQIRPEPSNADMNVVQPMWPASDP